MVDTPAEAPAPAEVVENAPPPTDTPTEPAIPETPAPETDWRLSLAGDNADRAKSLERFSSANDFMDAYDKQGTDLAAQAVRVPSEDASEEEVSAYRAAIGVPDDPSGYDIQLAEEHTPVDELTMDFLRTSSHEMGFNQEQVAKVIEMGQQRETALQQAESAALQKSNQETELALKAQWGTDFKENSNLVGALLNQYFGDDRSFLQTKDGNGVPLGSNPEFANLLADHARLLSSDGALVGGHSNPGGVDDTTLYNQLMDLKEGDAAQQTQFKTQNGDKMIDDIIKRKNAERERGR